MMDKNIEDSPLKKDWMRAKSFSLVVATGVIGYKVIVTPFVFTVDFPTFLSLLLAVFSVFLAALFYFKATDTSNTFYDNTYKFTQDIASLLVKIESGFGGKLRHLDEGYASMREKLDKFPGKYAIEETKTEIKKEEEEFNQILRDKDRMIDELAKKAHLRDSEREQFKEELNKRIEELNSAQNEISFLRKHLQRSESEPISSQDLGIDEGMSQFIMDVVFSEIPAKHFLNAPSSFINKKFKSSLENSPKGFLEDLNSHGMIDENQFLTRKGKSIFRWLAKNKLKINNEISS